MTWPTMPLAPRRSRLPVGPLLGLGLLTCAGLALVATNPTMREYEEHAGSQLVELASAEFCDGSRVPMMFQLWIRDCPALIATQRETLSALASRFTTRWNFGIGSLYQLSIGGQELMPGVTLPEVDVVTLGIAGTFLPLRVASSDGAGN